MKILFIYLDSWDTPKKISQKLKTIYGSNFIDLTTEDYSGPYDRSTILIRYGTSSNSYLDQQILSGGGKIINSASSISNNCNKLSIFEALKSLNLPTPKIWREKREINKFPVLGRDVSHMAANDVIVIKGNDNLRLVDFNRIPDKDYYIELIKNTTEYRFYCYKDKVFKVFKKVFTGRDIKTDRRDIPRQDFIKNDTFGWEFQTTESYNVPNFAAIKQACMLTLGATNMQFGAYDLAVENSTGKVFLFENNSAPWMGENSLDLFVRVLTEDVNGTINYRPKFAFSRIWNNLF